MTGTKTAETTVWRSRQRHSCERNNSRVVALIYADLRLHADDSDNPRPQPVSTPNTVLTDLPQSVARARVAPYGLIRAGRKAGFVQISSARRSSVTRLSLVAATWALTAKHDGRLHHAANVSFTALTSCLSVNGFAKNAN
jgi:hypothetical protein